MGMTQNHNDFGSQIFAGKLQRTYGIKTGYIAGQTHTENVAQTLIKYQFCRCPAITATQDRSKGN